MSLFADVPPGLISRLALDAEPDVPVIARAARILRLADELSP